MAEDEIRRSVAAATEFTPDDVAAESCPLLALGERGGRYFFLVKSGELREVAARDMTNPSILLSLFGGDAAWLKETCPKFEKDGAKLDDWAPRAAGARLMRMCAKKGLWDEENVEIRKRGVWRDKAGALVVHAGDHLFYAQGKVRLGVVVDGAVYPAEPRISPPDQRRPATAIEAQECRAMLDLWRYRDSVGADLAFGWVSGALLGAAPPWRAHGQIAGEQGGGKSALGKLLLALLGEQGRRWNNFSEAGMRQTLSGEARGILLDEAEASVGAGRVQMVIELLRAMSGDEGLKAVRGSAGGRSQGYTAASPVMLLGITPPALLPQDRNRITEIDLVARRHAGGASEARRREDEAAATERLEAAFARAAELSCRLRGRALLGWGRYRDNLARYHATLVAAGCDTRQADQLGALLAASEMMLADEVVTHDTATVMVEKLRPMIRRMIAVEQEDSDARQGLTRLLTSPVDNWRGGDRSTVGGLIERASEHAMEQDGVEADKALLNIGLRLETKPPPTPEAMLEKARLRALSKTPPRILDLVDEADILRDWAALQHLGSPYLVVANRHEALSRIFEGSRWPEGWPRMLQRLEGAAVTPIPVRFRGDQARGVIVHAMHLPVTWRPPPEEDGEGSGAASPPGPPDGEADSR
jgi:hypothetical protein